MNQPRKHTNFKKNHGIITNVEFIALAMFYNPGQNGAFYRKMVLKSLDRPFTRGYYCSYFRTHWARGPSYGGLHWINRSTTNKYQWHLSPQKGLQTVVIALRKLKKANMEFEDLLN
tara:strand:+ start:555 stop:902 length:348 start_codon:yes stop_codon:yes gene_type:complete